VINIGGIANSSKAIDTCIWITVKKSDYRCAFIA